MNYKWEGGKIVFLGLVGFKKRNKDYKKVKVKGMGSEEN